MALILSLKNKGNKIILKPKYQIFQERKILRLLWVMMFIAYFSVSVHFLKISADATADALQK